jgi:hypothetical protein
MKKLIVSLCLSLTLFMSSTRQTQAAALAISASGGSSIAQVFFGLSALSMTLGCLSDGMQSDGWHANKMCSSVGRTNGLGDFGIVLAIIGIITLEGDQQFSLTSLTNDQAQKIGLSERELISFNSNIDELNLVLASSTEDLMNHGQISDEEAETIVKSHGQDIESDAFSAFMKLRAFNRSVAQSLMAK